MSSPDGLLHVLGRDPRLADLLAATFEFDVSRGDAGQAAELSSGQPLEPVAGDFSGGRYYLCGGPDTQRPLLYASSEGQAGLIGDSLAEALEVIIGLPYWQDCVGFSGDGDLEVMTTTAGYSQRDLLERDPEIGARQSEAATALSLELLPPDVLLARLHAAASRTEPDFVFKDETGEYENLFGPFLPDRNPRWR